MIQAAHQEHIIPLRPRLPPDTLIPRLPVPGRGGRAQLPVCVVEGGCLAGCAPFGGGLGLCACEGGAGGCSGRGGEVCGGVGGGGGRGCGGGVVGGGSSGGGGGDRHAFLLPDWTAGPAAPARLEAPPFRGVGGVGFTLFAAFAVALLGCDEEGGGFAGEVEELVEGFVEGCCVAR